jgi:hypothetical protein
MDVSSLSTKRSKCTKSVTTWQSSIQEINKCVFEIEVDASSERCLVWFKVHDGIVDLEAIQLAELFRNGRHGTHLEFSRCTQVGKPLANFIALKIAGHVSKKNE